ncbi:hypothetical protein P4S63_22270 [Pseudoalteromonas sp. B193]
MKGSIQTSEGFGQVFEAGIRAVLGQQVSVTAAHNLVTKLVDELKWAKKKFDAAHFPTAKICC